MAKRALVTLAVTVIIGLSAAPALARLVQFRTPSGYIGCIGESLRADNTVRCDIRTRSWSPPPKPRACQVDWGQGLSVDRRGRSRWVCAGDTALNRGPVLAYGSRRLIGGIRCVSRTTGLTCTNLDGHGFSLSRQRYRRF